MALTELQLPNKSEFYSNLQNTATQMADLMQLWESLASFIGFIDTADMDAMNIATGQVRTDLVNLRTWINELIDFYNGNPVTVSNPPREVINKIRRMIVR